MFDQLYTLSDGQCVYQGNTQQLVPFLSTLNLECPSYHNPASYIIEVACGEHGDNISNLVRAIENGKKDIRTEMDYQSLKSKLEKNMPKVHSKIDNNLKSTYEKNEKFSENISGANNELLPKKINNDIVKGTDNIAISVEEPGTETALLSEETGDLSPERYPTSEFHQFWVVLKRTLLFSRRDWVSLIWIFLCNNLANVIFSTHQTLMYLRLFAHILVGFLIGALYYDIGNDGAKVLSNLGFLFFNMLFLMYTSMTITILSCKFVETLILSNQRNLINFVF